MTTMMTRFAEVLLWDFVATILQTTIMLGAQGLGLSRLSLSFLFGAAATDRLRRAHLFGYALDATGGRGPSPSSTTRCSSRWGGNPGGSAP